MAGMLPVASGRAIVAATATAVRLSTTQYLCSQVIIQAETDNTGVMTIGGSGVVGTAGSTRVGVALAAGESLTFYTKDLYNIWLDGTVNGDGVTFIALSE